MRTSPARARALENARFLERLALSGNARLAAREVGRAHTTFYHRRTRDAAFAQRWDAAVAAAHARFHLAGGKRGPEPEGGGADKAATLGAGARRALRTRGGEPMVVRTRTGKLQLRPAHPNKLTRAAEQVFLAALSATANIRLSAAAAGASTRAFDRRRRRNPAFAQRARRALEMGYERLELAMLIAARSSLGEDEDWFHAEAAPIPPMTPGQAIQLLQLHFKSVRHSWEEPHRRRRRGESDAVYTERLAAMWRAERGREAEEAAWRRAARYEQSGEWAYPGEPPLPELPPLHLVTGWSKADPAKAARNADGAPFGGWGIEDMRRAMAERGRGRGKG
jgi:hypothetical protein